MSDEDTPTRLTWDEEPRPQQKTITVRWEGLPEVTQSETVPQRWWERLLRRPEQTRQVAYRVYQGPMPQNVKMKITGLKPGQTYSFRFTQVFCVCGKAIYPPTDASGIDLEWVHADDEPFCYEGWLDDDGEWHDPPYAEPVKS